MLQSDIRKLALNLALSQIGYKEKARNWNIFARDLSRMGIPAPQNAPYCAIGNAWAYRTWLDFTKVFSLPWYVPGIWSDAKRLGLTTSNPVDGDLVIFDWTMNRSPDHTGIAYPSKGSRYSVEFNTAAGVGGSQSNGDGVYLRRRDASDIVGYVSVEKVAKYLRKPLTSSKAAPLPVIRSGARGDYAGAVQRAVGAKADNVFGRDTLTLVKAFQRKHGLTPDGVVGAATWAKINESKAAPAPYVRLKLRLGSRGDSVKEIQRKLGGLGVDGVFGPKTLAKVKAFQKSKGLAVDGVVGSDTWSALLGRRVHVS